MRLRKHCSIQRLDVESALRCGAFTRPSDPYELVYGLTLRREDFLYKRWPAENTIEWTLKFKKSRCAAAPGTVYVIVQPR